MRNKIKKILMLLFSGAVIVGILWVLFPSILIVWLILVGLILLAVSAEKDREEQRRESDKHAAEVLEFEKLVGAKQ